jgi:hypothetical protein
MNIRLSKSRVGDKQRGVPGTYGVRDRNCIGCRCFAPGEFQVRGATMSGSRATGAVTKVCLNREYRGCPDDTGFSIERVRERKAEGWKV